MFLNRSAFEATAYHFLELGAECACFEGLAGIVCTQTGGLVAARSICIDELHEPERRILFLVERRHKLSAVCAVNRLQINPKPQQIQPLSTTLYHHTSNESSIPFTRSIENRHLRKSASELQPLLHIPQPVRIFSKPLIYETSARLGRKVLSS